MALLTHSFYSKSSNQCHYHLLSAYSPCQEFLKILFLLTQLNINILLGRTSKLKIIKWLSQGQKPVCGLARIWISLWCQCPPRFCGTLSPHLLHVTYTLCIFLTLGHPDASIGHLPPLSHPLKSDFSENTTFMVPPGTLGQILLSELVLFCLFFSQAALNQCWGTSCYTSIWREGTLNLSQAERINNGNTDDL